jgi:hypothetical protein
MLICNAASHKQLESESLQQATHKAFVSEGLLKLYICRWEQLCST